MYKEKSLLILPCPNMVYIVQIHAVLLCYKFWP
ncbi:hypothetical protein FQN60_011435 [Etheostoma spectabile]|uniref:Uncharacterized protein n=1 Tax=Etheostoma spectabile TaxID=54343 RepID=A0A5J5DRZ5_9PERO|nr:hypothetical protein FQN60_011435 [Etheostoma spectabile]